MDGEFDCTTTPLRSKPMDYEVHLHKLNDLVCNHFAQFLPLSLRQAAEYTRGIYTYRRYLPII